MRIDRTRKIPLTVLVRALGFGSDDLIQEIFGDSETLRLTLDKDVHKRMDESRTEEALKDIMTVYVLVNQKQLKVHVTY